MCQPAIAFDARKEVREGREPFWEIVEAVARLGENESLRLITSAEPLALFSVMARQGFSHQSTHLESGDWEVMFQRPAIPRAAEESPASRQSAASTGASDQARTA